MNEKSMAANKKTEKALPRTYPTIKALLTAKTVGRTPHGMKANLEDFDGPASQAGVTFTVRGSVVAAIPAEQIVADWIKRNGFTLAK
jgi:hypothetical protein